MLDVAVLGGGLIGCAIARHLARGGLRVGLFERRRVAAEASGAAAGTLAVQSESADPAALRLALRSRALYPPLLASLRDEVGARVEWSRTGTVCVAFSAADEARLHDRLGMLAAEGAPAEWLSARHVRAVEPGIGPAVRSGVLCPLDARVDPPALTAALAQSAAAAGCVVYAGEDLRSVVVERGAVAGVVTDTRRIACHAAVNAMGAWAGRVRGMTPLPVQPVRGQIAVVRAERPPFRHAVVSARGYAVPRRDGRVLLGSTREAAGFRKRVTAGGLAAILANALELAPGLGALPLLDSWSGLRPGSADGRPIVGRDPAVRNYIVATGHDRDGVLLAPVTAELVAGMLRGEVSEWDEALSVARFAQSPGRSSP